MDIQKYIELLREIIKTPSFSGEENGTADILSRFLSNEGIPFKRVQNNLIAINHHFDPHKENFLLNSHHDTVKVNAGWTRDPFGAEIEDGNIFGLGSNDAGGPLIALLAAFIHYYNKKDLPFNIVFTATAEEETFGPNGLSALLVKELPDLSLGIIGEPTGLALGVAEKGLLVLDVEYRGKAGHAARDTGVNAIYLAMEDITWFRNYKFDQISEHLGPVTMQVTKIEAGYQHNVIPDICRLVVDIRINDCYSNTDILKIVRQNIQGIVTPRSLKWNSRSISMNHPVVKKAQNMGIPVFGSPTLSDQVHCDFPTVKIGPGQSERSHTPDEYIGVDELKEGIHTVIQLLDGLQLH